MKQPSLKKQAFTLIEMMVVVAILAILSTLLIVGISKLQTNAKRQQTAQILENCRAMWAEYDSVNRLHIDPTVTGAPGNVTLENEIATEQAQGANGFGDRIGTAVVYTRAVFALMRSQPSIRAEMDKFPSGRMFLTSQATAPQFQNNGGMMNIGFGIQQAPTYSAQKGSTGGYSPGSLASYTDPISGASFAYLCIHTASDGTVTSPPDKGYWMPVNGLFQGQQVVDTQDPVLLDAWGNPIICIIGGYFGGLGQNGQPIPLNADGSIPPNQGILRAGGKSVILTSAGNALTQINNNSITGYNRIFWASAGPDGDFSKGDDNIYSFEKN